MNYSTSKNQEICGKLVQREVMTCASYLVSELAGQEKYMEDLMDVCVSDDWESAVRDEVYSMVDKSDVVDLYEFMTISKDHNAESNDDIEDIAPLKENLLDYIDKIDGWAEAGDFMGIDPHRLEALEHWIVSDWFASKLQGQGEMIVNDFLGLTLWGRSCSGQAILLDHVIGAIAEGMEILEGQTNEWK